MARPKKFNEEKDRQLKAILRLKPTLKDCAAFLDVSQDTIIRYIEKTYKTSYANFREQNMVHTRFSLIRTALKQAESGNTAMLIFCLKNMCGWTDKNENINHDSNIQVTVKNNAD